MGFALLVQDRTSGAVKIAKRGAYTDCLAARAVLTARFGFLAVVWAVNLTPEFGEVTDAECPGITAARGPRKTLRQKFAELDELTGPVTPETAGTRYTSHYRRAANPGRN
jgi:hypothetical protein